MRPTHPRWFPVPSSAPGFNKPFLFLSFSSTLYYRCTFRCTTTFPHAVFNPCCTHSLTSRPVPGGRALLPALTMLNACVPLVVSLGSCLRTHLIGLIEGAAPQSASYPTATERRDGFAQPSKILKSPPRWCYRCSPSDDAYSELIFAFRPGDLPGIHSFLAELTNQHRKPATSDPEVEQTTQAQAAHALHLAVKCGSCMIHSELIAA